MSLDITKPLTTRDGRKITDMQCWPDGRYTAMIDGVCHSYDRDGHHATKGNLDLVNTSEELKRLRAALEDIDMFAAQRLSMLHREQSKNEIAHTAVWEIIDYVRNVIYSRG